MLLSPKFQTGRLSDWNPEMDLWWWYKQDRNPTKYPQEYERSLLLKLYGKGSYLSLFP